MTLSTLTSKAAHRWRKLELASLFVLAVFLFVAFTLIERGVGDFWRSMLFVGFDFLLVGALAVVLLILTSRWRISLLTAVAAVLLIWFSSRTKMQHTAMAAVAGDIRDLIGAWHVVAPFAWPVLAVASAVLLVVVVAAFFERPVHLGRSRRLAAGGLGASLLAGCVAIAGQVPVEDPLMVGAGSGPKIALFFRSIYEQPRFSDNTMPALGDFCCFDDRRDSGIEFRGKIKPNIVVVLQESTFPPSNLKGVAPASNFLLDGSMPLHVHVMGGGTWVEEYALLHGVAPPVYGPDFAQIMRLGPKLGLKGRLAKALAGHGYSTHSIAPLPGHVLDARTMHASLGIQHFRGCEDVDLCGKGQDWNAIPDSAYYREILQALRAEMERPLFYYVATIRQHSPHVQRYPLRAYKAEILAEYRRRLELSAREAQAFVNDLRSLPRPTVVLMFGDHIPADMVDGFSADEFAVDRFQTFFNVYGADGRGDATSVMAHHGVTRAVDSSYLDAILLRQAGFSGDYIDTKLAAMIRCGALPCPTRPAADIRQAAAQ